MTVAILTGDLIGSTRAAPGAVAATMRVLADCAAAIGPEACFTRSRGDGWQMRGDPRHALRDCLFIQARLLAAGALPSRIAVGIGAEHPATGPDLSSAMGPAFTASGRALEAMARHDLLAIAGDGIDRFRTLAFTFAADYIRRWSRPQAEAMALLYHPDADDSPQTQGSIAQALGITRQAVGARLKSAGNDVLSTACEAFFADRARSGA